MEEERVDIMQTQEQIMIMIDDYDQNEEDRDLMQKLVQESTYVKKTSLHYDYEPAPIIRQNVEYAENTGLKTSNRSTETCADSEGPTRRCFCSKTRCQKNYCECFKQGLPCTSDCQCISCGNKQQLFLIRSSQNGTKCKCPKSHCLKKYCECHSSGRKCGAACKCIQCHNKQESMQEQLHHSCHQIQEIDHLIFLNI